MSDLYVIVGLGITGLSCAKYLHERNIAFAVMDTRRNPPHLPLLKKILPDVMVSLGDLDEGLLDKASKIILSPGISLKTPAISKQVRQGKSIIGDIELFAQAVSQPVIAITGTNAKSTVTTLVGEMAKEAHYQVQVGGNLGVPALALLENKQTELFVLELSSFQLETTYSLKPKVATILNITPDHMDRYENLKAYQDAKHRVYQQAEIAIESRDDPLTFCHEPSVKDKLRFTLQKPNKKEFGLLVQQGKTFLAFEETPLLATEELPLTGKHAQANALASLAIGHAMGFPLKAMLQVLKTFKGLPHRCQLVRERQEVKWFNDSKGTNVGATVAAIEGLGSEITGKLILIAGGMGKNADFYPLVPALARYTREVILIGEAAKELAAVIGKEVPTTFANDMADAVMKASIIAQPKDSVLLSPACASFDMFKNFEHRGEVFTEMVKQLV